MNKRGHKAILNRLKGIERIRPKNGLYVAFIVVERGVYTLDCRIGSGGKHIKNIISQHDTMAAAEAEIERVKGEYPPYTNVVVFMEDVERMED